MAEIEIDAMTLGPYGVGRLDGKAVMVPGAVPGDRVDVAIEAERRDFLLAKIVSIVRPSSDRRAAPCPFVPRCGGCDWQHIDYAAQVRIKGELIAREIGHAIGREIDPASLVEPAPKEFGYRSRIRLKVGAHGSLGFHAFSSNSIVEIDSCLVAEPGLKMPLHLARSLGKRVEEIEVVRGAGRDVLVADLKKPPDAEDLRRAGNVMEHDRSIAGIVMRGGARREVIGDATIAIELEPGLALEAEADLFSQVNRPQNQKLVAEVMEIAVPHSGMALLDLFCGAGNFSIPAARRGARVTGVDSEAAAIAAAARNAKRLGFTDAQFIAMKASETAGFLLRARYRPEIAILDPPRSGAAILMTPLMKLTPQAIVYVSCDATTLARDLRSLAAGGYELHRVRAFDFFPNTHHTEIVAHLLLT
ncbi:MAG TPA: class I SAM-dependent RNA methyltransferase [Candidatus Binataceae bacterium]|nr:class I SAM-dependent RNA methyltransferase [Candidatus Binataceae bacterium]